jgi:ribosomal protein S18 acetylase RimI-like enzyme
MRLMEGFGMNAGLAKAMLTVFSENTEAVRFYMRIGSVAISSYSMRFGRVADHT